MQAFFPSKIFFQQQCSDLRENKTDTCSNSCNSAIKDFLNNTGGEKGRIFFTCTCTEDSHLYPRAECDIDRGSLIACPALSFLLPVEVGTTAEPAEGPTRSTSTKEAPSTKPITPPGEDCRRAKIRCKGGISCTKAFDYVVDSCLQDFTSNGECSKSCSHSVEILDRYPTSKDLWGCNCDLDSEEASWCPMYGKNGLREWCVKYRELDDKETDKRTEEEETDPRGRGVRPAVSLLAVIIPSVLTMRLI